MNPLDILRIPVERLAEGPLDLEFDLDPRLLDLDDEMFKFKDRVRGTLQFKAIGRDVRALGKLTARCVCPCARCLAEVEVPLDVPADLLWLHRDPRAHDYVEPESDEILAEYYFGDAIDAAEPVRETILAELPDLVHCREDCKGLCPNCGANRNEEPCDCAKGDECAEPEWKRKLRALHPDE